MELGDRSIILCYEIRCGIFGFEIVKVYGLKGSMIFDIFSVLRKKYSIPLPYVDIIYNNHTDNYGFRRGSMDGNDSRSVGPPLWFSLKNVLPIHPTVFEIFQTVMFPRG